MKKRIIRIDQGGIIYKTTNLLTGLIYVGKHSFPLRNGYLGSGHDFLESVNVAKKIAKARSVDWRIYFVFEVIDVCHNNKTLNKRERYWIDILDARNPEIGYNIAIGGEGWGVSSLDDLIKRSKPICQYDELGYFVSEYYSINEASSITGISDSLINQCLKGKINSAKGFIFRYKIGIIEKKIKIDFKIIKRNHKNKHTNNIKKLKRMPIKQYIYNGIGSGQFISGYLNIEDMVLKTGISFIDFRECYKRGFGFCNGFFFEINKQKLPNNLYI